MSKISIIAKHSINKLTDSRPNPFAIHLLGRRWG